MSDDISQDEKVARLVSVTATNPEVARRTLEVYDWDLDTAVTALLDLEEDDNNDIPAAVSAPEPQPPVSQPMSFPSAPKKAPPRGGIATLDQYNREDQPDDDDHQAFFVGGSERSGQQTLGPPKKKPTDIIKNVFEDAKRHGAETVEKSSHSGGPSTSSNIAFSGTGATLGDAVNSSQPVSGVPKPKKMQDFVLKLYKNGFTVNDGDLRKFEEPASLAFLNAIKQGVIPDELVKEAKGAEVNLDMEDCRDQDYVPPKKTTKPFSGQGARLGNVLDKPSTSSSQSIPETSQSTNSGDLPPVALPNPINVDDSQPTTSIQIRLADGTRLVQKFNMSHTVTDIRNFIASQRPQVGPSDFRLMTSFPTKECSDDSATLESANLANTVLIQRMK